MILNNTKTKLKDSGFTIVELLVVIVVIGILAAITIVSYTGVTARANTTKALTNANSVSKVAEVYYAENNRYPSVDAATAMVTANWTTTGVPLPTTAKVPAGITLVPGSTALTNANGAASVSIACLTTCTNTTGGRIGYYDFSASSTLYIYFGAAKSGDAFVNPAS